MMTSFRLTELGANTSKCRGKEETCWQSCWAILAVTAHWKFSTSLSCVQGVLLHGHHCYHETSGRFIQMASWREKINFLNDGWLRSSCRHRILSYMFNSALLFIYSSVITRFNLLGSKREGIIPFESAVSRLRHFNIVKFSRARKERSWH